MSLDDTLAAAEVDAAELDQLFRELQNEIAGLDDLDEQIAAFSKKIDMELKS